jgi:hypothetical protein
MSPGEPASQAVIAGSGAAGLDRSALGSRAGDRVRFRVPWAGYPAGTEAIVTGSFRQRRARTARCLGDWHRRAGTPA